MSGTTGYQRRLGAQGGGGIVRMPLSTGPAPLPASAANEKIFAGLSEAVGGIARVAEERGREERNQAEQRAIFAAQEEARTAPILDGNGNISVDQRDPLTSVGRAFNAGMAQRISAEFTTRAEVEAVRVRGEAAGDPDRFQQLWQGRATGLLPQVPQWMRSEAEATLARVGAGHQVGLGREAITQERHLQAATFGAEQEALEREGLGLASAGVTSGAAFDSWSRRYGAKLEAGVTSRQITPEVAELRRQDMRERTLGAATVRSTQDRIRAGETPEAVLREFDAAMDQQQLPGPQRERLRNLVEGSIAEQQAIRREARTEATAKAEDWEARITGGVPVAPEEGASIAADLDRTGAPRTAQRVRDINEVQQDARVYGTLSTAELARKAQENAARVLRPEASARDVRLSELSGRMLQQRQRAMEADPLAAGAAVHQRALGGGLSSLDLDNSETLAAGLKAREGQAAAIAAREGRAVPVLTRAEAEGMKRILIEGSPDQQGAFLRGLTGLSPSVMRATLDQLVQGDDASPRVRAFSVAAARQAGAPRLSSEILQGMEVMRQVRPAAVEGNEWRRALFEEMGPVLPTRPDALASVGEAARAIYAQRYATGDKPGDLAGRLDVDKFKAILGEIMPTVTFGNGWYARGQRVPVPRPGMTQVQFDEEMARMPGAALDGARAADGRAFTPAMLRDGGRLVPVGEGTFEIRYGGREVLDAEGRTFRLDMTRPWPAQQVGVNEPRGLRNNNPLNLSFANQPGATMETHATPRFARFGTMEEGVAASVSQIVRYSEERGLNTVAGIVGRWAPPNENDTPAYVGFVSRQMGVGPNDRIDVRDRATMEKLVAAMGEKEVGRPLDAGVVRRGVGRALG